MKGKVIVKNAVKVRDGHFYFVDKNGNLCSFDRRKKTKGRKK